MNHIRKHFPKIIAKIIKDTTEALSFLLNMGNNALIFQENKKERRESKHKMLRPTILLRMLFPLKINVYGEVHGQSTWYKWFLSNCNLTWLLQSL